jgi:energy-converting hydrogenase Eha subunit F
MKDLEYVEKTVNYYLKNIQLKVARRYNYIAIDIYKRDGGIIDTLIAGLSKREAYDILSSIARVLSLER